STRAPTATAPSSRTGRERPRTPSSPIWPSGPGSGRSRRAAPPAPTASRNTTSCSGSPKSWATWPTIRAATCTACDPPPPRRHRRRRRARGARVSGGRVRHGRLAEAAPPGHPGAPGGARSRGRARLALPAGARPRDRPGRAGARGPRAVRNDPPVRDALPLGAADVHAGGVAPLRRQGPPNPTPKLTASADAGEAPGGLVQGDGRGVVDRRAAGRACVSAREVRFVDDLGAERDVGGEGALLSTVARRDLGEAGDGDDHSRRPDAWCTILLDAV